MSYTYNRFFGIILSDQSHNKLLKLTYCDYKINKKYIFYT